MIDHDAIRAAAAAVAYPDTMDSERIRNQRRHAFASPPEPFRPTIVPGPLDVIRQLRAEVFDQPWRDQAACRGMDVALFFPEPGESCTEALKVCNGDGENPPCPVQQECAEYAAAACENHGIWGSTNNQRRVIKQEMGWVRIPEGKRCGPAPKPMVCGTEAAYRMHLRRGIPACDACKAAHTEYRRGRVS